MDPKPSPQEATEHLRLIRQTIERSQQHSTLSGISGIAAGVIVLIAAVVAERVIGDPSQPGRQGAFVGLWLTTLIAAGFVDLLITKIRAMKVGKSPLSGLGRSWLRAVAPGLLSGLIVSLMYYHQPERFGDAIYGLWMLSYAMSLLAIGQLSAPAVSVLGWSFLAAAGWTLLGPQGVPVGPRGMLAVTFGGFHIVYGIARGIRDGW